MNTILTDDEIKKAITPLYAGEEVLDLALIVEMDTARAVEAAVLAKLAQQEPVAWLRPSGKAMLETGGCCTVYASDGMSNHSAPLYTHPTPQQAGHQRVPDDLKNRCVEILGWQKTGVLTGNALRDFAKQKYGDDPHALQMAETETAREAYRVIAAAPEAPAQASESDERDRKDAERYRWLREQMLGVDFDWDESGKTALCFEMPDGCSFATDCDQVIDEARAELAHKGGAA